MALFKEVAAKAHRLFSDEALADKETVSVTPNTRKREEEPHAEEQRSNKKSRCEMSSKEKVFFPSSVTAAS
jgi:hypothetical protein